MNSCEERKCPYWDGQCCIDEEEYVDSTNGEPCCRFHSNAVLNVGSQYKNGLQKAIEIIEKELEYARKANPLMAMGMLQIKQLIEEEIEKLD